MDLVKISDNIEMERHILDQELQFLKMARKKSEYFMKIN